jgi:hypothetical protein
MRWRWAPNRVVSRRGGPPRGAPILLGAALSLGLAAILAILLETSRRAQDSPFSLAPVGAASSVITRSQTVSIGFVRATARRQLGQARRQLDACAENRTAHLSRRALPGWRDCVRWPIAHLAVSARTNEALLGALSNELPAGKCRSLVLGTSNTSRILGAAANELLRGLFNNTRAGLGLSDQHYASVTGLIGYVRDMIRGRTWRACRPANVLSAPVEN